MITPLNTRPRGLMIFVGITTVLLMPSCDAGLARGETGGSHDEAVETVDVVIVGAGISGLTAALELGRGGANVMVVDMASVFGGHAVMSLWTSLTRILSSGERMLIPSGYVITWTILAVIFTIG